MFVRGVRRWVGRSVGMASLSSSAPSAHGGGARPRGALLLFEGVDRCGKTTQAQRLAADLAAEGVPTAPMRFPDRTTAIGSKLHEYLTRAEEMDDRAVHLLFAANRWEKV
jgi:dTMP kinase